MIHITNENELQNICQGNLEIYFVDFLKALLRVDSHFLIWPYPNGVNQQMIERVFAYELYHQWRLITTQNTDRYENIIINGEIRKDQSVIRHPDLGEVYPDLILHQQQDNLDQQLLACEIKTLNAIQHTNGKKQLKKDLVKLDNYIQELSFNCTVFVQILNINDYFETAIIPYIRRNLNNKNLILNNLENIFYIIKDYGYIKYDTLQNIVNNMGLP